MRRKRKCWMCFIVALLTFMAFVGEARGEQDAVLRGEASIWFSLAKGQPSTPRFGLRYIPTLSLDFGSDRGAAMDAELSANAYLTGAAPGWIDLETDETIKPYRMWIRLSSTQYELRAGLQKINFGSASIFRPLRWFDQMDARDPLQITDGVYGLLFRYYFVNNANIWAWGLFGNTKPKGWEARPTRRNSLEYGARIQVPLFKGELAATYHRRFADLGEEFLQVIPEGDPAISENRFGVDGKWDIGIGIWFEGGLIHQDHQSLPLPYQRTMTLGADYTFGMGNGLHVLAEHFVLARTERMFGSGEGLRLTALSLRYPAGIMDNLSAFVYYDWENDQFFRFASWQRTYDRWQLFLIGFWNPEDSSLYQTEQGNGLFAGAGFQIMVVFNH